MGKEFMQKHRLQALSSTRQALQSLMQQEKLYHNKDEYIVYDRFFSMFSGGWNYNNCGRKGLLFLFDK